MVPLDYEASMKDNITLGLAIYRPENPRGAIFLCVSFEIFLLMLIDSVILEAVTKRRAMHGRLH